MIIAITVTGKDRPGIISALSEVLYRVGGNLEDASMTILEGEFAMIFLAALPSKSIYSNLGSALANLERRMGLVISLKEIKHRLIRGEKHEPGSTSWVVSVLGKDRAGIVYRISQLLADYGLNITDLNSKIIGTGHKTAYVLILEVDVPRRASKLIKQLKQKFKALQKKLGVTIAFNPFDSALF